MMQRRNKIEQRLQATEISFADNDTFSPNF